MAAACAIHCLFIQVDRSKNEILKGENNYTTLHYSQLRAVIEVALASEKKAYAFYDGALASVKQPDIKALFEELRDEEAEHIHVVQANIAKLPPKAAIDLEDVDAD